MATDVERVHYYPRQYLGVEDFQAEQAYHRDMRRRHNLAHHTWGVVAGLELVFRQAQGAQPGAPGDVSISPGLAVDAFGRELVNLAPYQLDPTPFSRLAGDDPAVGIWIAYRETGALQPPTGFQQCDPVSQFARTQETFFVAFAPPTPVNASLTVASQPYMPPPAPAPTSPLDPSLPLDSSVPYQDLPDDPSVPTWYVYLGTVSWKQASGQVPGGFVGADSDSAGRIHAGVVAGQVTTPGEKLLLRRRQDPPDADLSRFLVWVGGRLQVAGEVVAESDVELVGGRLAFGDPTLEPSLWMRRTGSDLRLHLGKPDTSQKLSIGAGANSDGSADVPVLQVDSQDRVVLPTGSLSLPNGSIGFGAGTRQMLNLWQDVYGIGIQDFTLYFRTDPAGDFQSGRLQVAGDVEVGGSLLLGGSRIPCDVITGVGVVNQDTSAGAIDSVWSHTVQSRLPAVGSATVLVGLADLVCHHGGGDSKWRATAQNIAVSGRQVSFDVPYHVEMGALNSFTWAVICLP
ncbi:MAG: hypothetical protein E6J41_08110 [Chloroflexi bacterium]|nr:MAG: hypothetical protein E6J41_08110 [Chloroflexota bacterium]